MTAPLSSTREKTMDVDDLANEIRRLDGDHLNRLGAGALAEALMPFLRRFLSPDVAVLREALVDKAIDGAKNQAIVDLREQLDRARGFLAAAIAQVANVIMERDRARQALAGAGEVVLAGWKLVPVEATEEMLQAGVDMVDRSNPYKEDVTNNIWVAMLSSAPSAAEGDQK